MKTKILLICLTLAFLCAQTLAKGPGKRSKAFPPTATLTPTPSPPDSTPTNSPTASSSLTGSIPESTPSPAPISPVPSLNASLAQSPRSPNNASSLSCISSGTLRLASTVVCYITVADSNGPIPGDPNLFTVTSSLGTTVDLPLTSDDGGYTLKFALHGPEDLEHGVSASVSVFLVGSGLELSSSPQTFTVCGMPTVDTELKCDQSNLRHLQSTVCTIKVMGVDGPTTALATDFSVTATDDALVSDPISSDGGYTFTFTYSAPSRASFGSVAAELASSGKHIKGSPRKFHLSDLCVAVESVAPESGSEGTLISVTGYGFGQYQESFGTALAFNGISSVVSVGDSEPLEVATSFTIEAWIHTPPAFEVMPLYSHILSVGDYTGYDLLIETGASPAIRHFAFATLVQGHGWKDDYVVSPTVLKPDTWYHVAAVRSESHLRLFLNGMLDKEVHGHPGPVNYGASPAAVIGGKLRGGESSEVFFGEIDELRVWNRALDSCTIRDWMHRSLTQEHSTFTNLVMYHKFDSSQPSNVSLDELGGLDGKLIGFSAGPEWVQSTVPPASLPIVTIGNSHCENVTVAKDTLLTCVAPASKEVGAQAVSIMRLEFEDRSNSDVMFKYRRTPSRLSTLSCPAPSFLPLQQMTCTIECKDSAGKPVAGSASDFVVTQFGGANIGPLKSEDGGHHLTFTISSNVVGGTVRVSVALASGSASEITDSPQSIVVAVLITVNTIPTTVFAGQKLNLVFDLNAPVPPTTQLDIIISNSAKNGNKTIVECLPGFARQSATYILPTDVKHGSTFQVTFGVTGSAASHFFPPAPASFVIVKKSYLQLIGLPPVVTPHVESELFISLGVPVPDDGPLDILAIANDQPLGTVRVPQRGSLASLVLNSTEFSKEIKEGVNVMSFELKGPSAKFYEPPLPSRFMFVTAYPVTFTGLETSMRTGRTYDVTAHIGTPVPPGSSLMILISSDDSQFGMRIVLTEGEVAQSFSFKAGSEIGSHYLSFSLDGIASDYYSVTPKFYYTLTRYVEETSVTLATSPTTVFSGTYFPFVLDIRKPLSHGEIRITALGSDGNKTEVKFTSSDTSTKKELLLWPQGNGEFNLSFVVSGDEAAHYIPPPPISFDIFEGKSPVSLFGAATNLEVGTQIPLTIYLGVQVPFGHGNLTIFVSCTNGFSSVVTLETGMVSGSFTFDAGDVPGTYQLSFAYKGEAAKYYLTIPSFGVSVTNGLLKNSKSRSRPRVLVANL